MQWMGLLDSSDVIFLSLLILGLSRIVSSRKVIFAYKLAELSIICTKYIIMLP